MLMHGDEPGTAIDQGCSCRCRHSELSREESIWPPAKGVYLSYAAMNVIVQIGLPVELQHVYLYSSE